MGFKLSVSCGFNHVSVRAITFILFSTTKSFKMFALFLIDLTFKRQKSTALDVLNEGTRSRRYGN